MAFALLLVPRLAAYGAGLFCAVMAGAFFTHITHNEQSRLPFILLLVALSLVVLVARRPVRGNSPRQNAAEDGLAV